MSNNRPVVYLDENAWVELGRAYYDQPRGKKFKLACETIIAASARDEAIFPLSAEHYIETRKRKDLASRKRLAKVMAHVSRGWSITPSEYLTSHEIRSAMARLYDAKQNDIPSFLGKGVDFAFGMADNPPDDLRVNSERWEELQRVSATEQGVEIFLTGILEVMNETRTTSFWDKMNSLAKTFDQTKKAGDAYPKDVRRRQVAAYWTIHHRDELKKILEVFSRNFDDFLALGEDRLLQLYDEVPTLSSEFALTSEHYKNRDRAFNTNDIWDISFLSVAIPYCDVVVTEKYWSSLAKRRKLDEKYQTTILGDLSKIESHLPS